MAGLHYNEARRREPQAPVGWGWAMVFATVIVPFMVLVALVLGGVIVARGRAGQGVAIMALAVLIAVFRASYYAAG